jgi:pilus assembly protein CpaB
MSKMRVVVLGVAVSAAALAAVLAKGFLGQAPQTEVVEIDKVPKVEVLIAAKDIQMGERMEEGALTWKEWPKESVAPTMITKEAKPTAKEDLMQGRARMAIFEGETINARKVLSPNDPGFMSAILPKGRRAISVKISEASSAGGFILPNDRVDVILTRKLDNPPDPNKLIVSETVLTNVRVLAINQILEKGPKKPAEGEATAASASDVAVAEGKTATLELDPAQSVVIANVETSGELSLALRSIAENDGKKLEEQKPELAGRFLEQKNNRRANETLFVRYGVEKYTTNR